MDPATRREATLLLAQRDKCKSMRGQTLLEFALVAPLFFILVCGLMDFGHLLYLQMTLQDAVQQAGRYAVTGNHQPDPNNPGQNLSRVNSIIQIAEQAAPGVNVSNISISSKHGGAGSAGGPGDIVTISLSTSMPLITPFVAKFFTGGAYSFTVSVTFMNETFPAGNTT